MGSPADLTERAALAVIDFSEPSDPHETAIRELQDEVLQLRKFISTQLEINQKILAQLADLTSTRKKPSKLIGIN